MKIYDISQEVFTSATYPDDPTPTREAVSRMEEGALYNLTCFSMCAHNGTHIDAPAHFIRDGKTVEAIALEKTVGPCCVVVAEGYLDAATTARILATVDAEAVRRILFKGDVTVTPEAAETLASAGVYLVGVESQSVGDIHAPMDVHRILLGQEVVLLEGLRLAAVPAGTYFLSAAPLALGGSDGAPCRALLIEL